MASVADLKDLVKHALGTPETVNFKALQKLLLGIITRISTLYKKIGEKVEDPDDSETSKTEVLQLRSAPKPSGPRRKSYAGNTLELRSAASTPSGSNEDQGEKDDCWAVFCYIEYAADMTLWYHLNRQHWPINLPDNWFTRLLDPGFSDLSFVAWPV